MKKISFLLCFVFLIFSCKEEIGTPIVEEIFYPALMEIPQGFPEVIHPEGNEFTRERWNLGKKLFFDPILSLDSTRSCASCHLPSLAFSDDIPFSFGVEDRIGTRNSPTLANLAYHPYFTREGGIPTLEQQILVPIQEHNEFDFNIVLVAERLARQEDYRQASLAHYNREPDAFVITRALSCFERSLLSGNSAYDKFEFQEDNTALDDSQKRGLNLFFSEKTDCFQCHGGFNFTNYAFENNGLYEEYEDEGRFRLTNLEEDRARFKVATLRNIELTAPYMHDGSLETLEAVVEHYNSGGYNHPQKSNFIRPLNLTEEEQVDLVRFLRTLTDASFVTNPLFSED